MPSLTVPEQWGRLHLSGMTMSSLPEFAPTGHVLVRAPSQLTEASADDFLRAFEQALPWSPWVIVDMSAVERLDGSGLGALSAAGSDAHRWGGGLVLVGIDENAVRAAEWALLERAFPHYASLDAVPALPPREPEVPRQRHRMEQPAD